MATDEYDPSNVQQFLGSWQRITLAALGFILILLIGIIIAVQGFRDGQGILMHRGPRPVFDLPLATTFACMALLSAFCFFITLPDFVSRSLVKGIGEQMKEFPVSEWEWEQLDPGAQLRVDKLGRENGGKLLQCYGCKLALRILLLMLSGMLGTFAYLIDSHWLATCVSGTVILFLLFMLPNDEKLSQWIDKQIPLLRSKTAVHSA